MKPLQETYLLKIVEAQVDYYNYLLGKVYPEEEMWLNISEDKKDVLFHDWWFYEIECYVNSDWVQWLAQQIIRYENKLKRLEA